MSQPWMKFYPSDWRADPALRMCSLAARGLWMEMLCIMHEAGGYLMVNEKQLLPRQLAVLSGASVDEVNAWLLELSDAGVFSRNADGTIYSRRILKDIARTEGDKANGRKGGNPNLKAGVNPPVNPTDKGGDKAQKLEARSQIPDRKEEGHEAVASPDNLIILPDPRADLYSRGIKTLAALTGRPDDKLRPLLGKWLKAANDDAVKVLRTIEDAARNRVADAVPWIEAALRAPKPEAQTKPDWVLHREKMQRWV